MGDNMEHAGDKMQARMKEGGERAEAATAKAHTTSSNT
ncbi:hypothetical protein HaLaN_32160, partial [Haematococcus lacustris]